MTTQKESGKNFIEHFGVKGMKWGVRRSKAQLSGKKEGGDKNPSSKPKAEKKSSSPNSRDPKKSVKDMSDKELKDYVNRLNMEQQYARMQPTPFSKRASKFASDIVLNAVKQQLTNQLSNEIGKQIGLAKTKSADRKVPKMRLVAPPTGPRLG